MYLKYQLTILIFLICKLYSPLYAQVNIQDSLALVDFYDSTNGDSWTYNTNWKTTSPVSTWRGVGVSNNRVVYLYMAGSHLSGHLPQSFGNLTQLKDLTLLDNQISGPIPSSLGNLVLLENMNISANPFGGSIPASLGNLRKIKIMLMYACGFTGQIPSTFKNLDSLYGLELDHNYLSGDLSNSLPNEIGLSIGLNRFTFDGIEQWAREHPDNPYMFYYSFQAKIPLKHMGDRLTVSAGGTLANDTFSWYKSGVGLVAKKVGDSTFRPTSPGNYYVEVTNSVAKDLILKSDTDSALAIAAEACPNHSLNLISNISGGKYQWQVSTDSTSYTDITDTAAYSGIKSSVLNIKSASSPMYGNRYKCIVDGNQSIFFTLIFKNSWIGNSSSSWQDVANWSCGAIPDENTDVFINSGAVVILNTDVTIRSLHLAPNAQLTVNAGFKLTVKQ